MDRVIIRDCGMGGQGSDEGDWHVICDKFWRCPPKAKHGFLSYILSKNNKYVLFVNNIIHI